MIDHTPARYAIRSKFLFSYCRFAPSPLLLKYTVFHLFRFHIAERLRIHMRIHTGEKPYECFYCDRAFAQSNDLKKHIRSHVGDNIYQCKDCPATFRFSRELQQHSNMHFLALQNGESAVKQDQDCSSNKVNFNSETNHQIK